MLNDGIIIKDDKLTLCVFDDGSSKVELNSVILLEEENGADSCTHLFNMIKDGLLHKIEFGRSF